MCGDTRDALPFFAARHTSACHARCLMCGPPHAHIARQLNYTMDIYFALAWGLACGFTHFLPYFYCVFFTSMITHRAFRDNERCSAKYGADWERYKEKVPYLMIPYVY
jgi:protein-S-isoprenylcysteine O-methyltransferase Ste14